jgi:glycerol-3-phosphate dehydrogenase (NAD(P)+)
MKKQAAVIGAGSWGTALASVLGQNQHTVHLWCRREALAEEINTTHRNEGYLKGVALPENIVATTDIKEAAGEASYIVLAVPSGAVRKIARDLMPYLQQDTIVVHAAKGIEPESFLRVSQILEEEWADLSFEGMAVLSGPSHAEEVAEQQPTTVAVSGTSEQVQTRVQELFMNQAFRVYTNDDFLGVELGGALKNIIALGIGLTSGLGYGDNAKAALMTRGLAEITRLGTHLGASPLTFTGLSGLGDLIVTCTSEHSRNWRAGNQIGSGKSLEDVLEQMGMVVEGVRTTEAVYHWSRSLGVEMPITEGLYKVLFEHVPPEKMAKSLMERGKKNEKEHSIMLLDNNN